MHELRIELSINYNRRVSNLIKSQEEQIREIRRVYRHNPRGAR